MRIARHNGGGFGIVVGNKLIDVTSLVDRLERSGDSDRICDIITNFDQFKTAALNAGDLLPSVALAESQLLAPILQPRKIIAMGSNYLEGTHEPPLPIWAFFKSPESITGPGGPIRLPSTKARIFHHEAELVAVIGKRGKNISVENAREHVFGYTVGIDVSGRHDVLPQSLFNKSHDTFSPIGPVIVTADEIPDPHRLQVRLWVDGSLRQDFNTSDMGHNIWDSISYVSSVTTLNPGDLLFTGTNHQGLGALQDGELVEVEIEQVGRLSVRVSDAQKRQWPQGIDKEIGQRVVRMLRDRTPVGSR